MIKTDWKIIFFVTTNWGRNNGPVTKRRNLGKKSN